METRHTPPGGTKHSDGLRRKSLDFPTGGAPPRNGTAQYNDYILIVILVRTDRSSAASGTGSTVSTGTTTDSTLLLIVSSILNSTI